MKQSMLIVIFLLAAIKCSQVDCVVHTSLFGCNVETTTARKLAPYDTGFISSFTEEVNNSFPLHQPVPERVHCWHLLSDRPIRFIFSALDLACDELGDDADVGRLLPGVTIFDGTSTNATAIATLCNRTLSYRYYQTRGDALIVFRNTSRSEWQNQGFVLSYHQVRETNYSQTEDFNDNNPCRKHFVVHQKRGSIESYRRLRSGKYRPNEKCSWLMDGRILLRLNYMSLEKSPLCDNDYLIIEQLRSDGKHVVAAWCGFRPYSSAWYSLNGRFLITFRTNSENESIGFSLEFEIQPFTAPAKSLGIVVPCGGSPVNLSLGATEMKSIASYKQPTVSQTVYQLRTQCKWFILSEVSQFFFRFAHVRLSDDNDSISVYNGGPRSTSNRIFRLSGPFSLDAATNEGGWYRSGPLLQIVLKTDILLDDTQFELEYALEPPAIDGNPNPHEDGETPCRHAKVIDVDKDTSSCIRNGRAAAGTYRAGENCSWIVASSHPLRVKFLRFQLESKNNNSVCASDSLAFYAEHEGKLGEYCGTSPPKDLTWSGDGSLKIVFKTDSSMEYFGFELCLESVSYNDSSLPTTSLMLDISENSCGKTNTISYMLFVSYLIWQSLTNEL